MSAEEIPGIINCYPDSWGLVWMFGMKACSYCLNHRIYFDSIYVTRAIPEGCRDIVPGSGPNDQNLVLRFGEAKWTIVRASLDIRSDVGMRSEILICHITDRHICAVVHLYRIIPIRTIYDC